MLVLCSLVELAASGEWKAVDIGASVVTTVFAAYLIPDIGQCRFLARIFFIRKKLGLQCNTELF